MSTWLTTRRRKLLACATGLLLVLTAVAVLAIRLRPNPPVLAAAVPADVGLYVEVPSVADAIAELPRLQGVDLHASTAAGAAESVVKALAAAFGLRPDEARELLGALQSAAVAARRVDDDVEAAVLLGFRSSAPVERLLGTARFRARGALGRSGRAYALAPMSEEAPRDPWVALLADAGLEGDARGVAWFPAERILVLGSSALCRAADAAMHEGAAALGGTPRYAAARGTLESPRVIALFDPALLRGPGLPDGLDPVTGAGAVVPPGLVLSLEGRVRSEALPARGAPAPPATALAARLPTETVAYVALSTKPVMRGRALQELVARRLAADDSAVGGALGNALDELGAQGLSIGEVYDALGDEGALALVAKKELDLGAGPSAKAAEGFAAVAIQRFRDPAIATRIVAALRSAAASAGIGGRFDLAHDEEGFVLRPRDTTADLPTARVALRGDALVVALGAPALIERSLDAYSRGKRVLGDNPAHARARAALPEAPDLVAWVDAGRFLHGLPPSLSWIRTAGDDRITSAIAVTLGRSDAAGACSFRLDTLNLPALVPIATSAVDLPRAAAELAAPPSIAAAPEMPGAAPIGVHDCDDYLDQLAICIQAMPSVRRGPLLVSAAETREAWRQLARAPEGKGALVSVCRAAVQTLPEYCDVARAAPAAGGG